MIPKVIHYCWFGKKDKTDLAKKCIESWRRYCPDYEIVEWNEDNFDFSCCDYAREAFEAQQYAFCSDYARLWVIQRYGGIYFDVDVELVKNIDSLLEFDAFFSSEENININTGIGFGALADNLLVKMIMEDYHSIHFIDPDTGRMDKTPCPRRNTEVIRGLYPSIDFSKVNRIDNMLFLPREYFCPLDYETRKMLFLTDETFGVHWFGGSWMSFGDRLKKPLRRITKKIGRMRKNG